MYILFEKINSHAQVQNYPYAGYAIFQIISEPIYYLIWLYFGQNVQYYENLPIRIGIVILCIPLLLVDRLSNGLQKFLPLYWYFTILYSLIFFFTFMLLKNNMSYMWSLNALSGVVLWILILDYKALAYLTPFGIILGIITYYITTPVIGLPLENLKTIFVTHCAVLVFGYIFSHRSDKFVKQKIRDLNSQSGAIAHEMRTPLANILMSGNIIQKVAKKMTEALPYDSVQKNDILKENAILLEKISQSLIRVTKGSNNLINLLLANLRQDFEGVMHTILIMSDCVSLALDGFSFQPQEESKIHVKICCDFKIKGNLEMIIHILFNLIKNSLYFIKACGKGEIFITVTQNDQSNLLIFKDTGQGIEARQLPNLFKPFYSKRPHGTGIGLSFCKKAIESMGGKITVESILNEYTTFTLYFPKIENSVSD